MLTLQVSVTQGSKTWNSRLVEYTRLSHFDFETRVSCLCWKETWTSLYWLSRLPGNIWETRTSRVSRFDIEMRVSYLWEETWTSRCWTSCLQVGPQKREPRELCALVSRRRLHMSNAVQKRHRVKPPVLYLLDRWIFLLLPSIVDVRDVFVDIQYSGYTSRVVRDPQ